MLLILLLSLTWLPPLCRGSDPPDSRESSPQLALPRQEDDFTIWKKPAKFLHWIEVTEATKEDLVCAAPPPALEKEFTTTTEAPHYDNLKTTAKPFNVQGSICNLHIPIVQPLESYCLYDCWRNCCAGFIRKIAI